MAVDLIGVVEKGCNRDFTIVGDSVHVKFRNRFFYFISFDLTEETL